MPHAPRASGFFESRPRLSQILAAFDERWPGARRRAAGLALAVAIEAALFLVLLTLGAHDSAKRAAGEALTTIDFAPEPAPDEQPPEPDQAATPTALPRAVPPPEAAPRPDRTVPLPVPMPPPAPIPLPRSQVPAADAPRIRAVVRDDMAGPVGPPDTGNPGDSQRVGSGPNGEAVYAARWYREPSEDELRGYLSTAGGPGWALINCRTVPGFRVEDCVLQDEYPAGAQLGRAVLAAAWQFKVRPPQVGGRVLVGEWVRIRISYEQRRR